MPRLLNAVIDPVFGTVFDGQKFPVLTLNDIYSRPRQLSPQLARPHSHHGIQMGEI